MKTVLITNLYFQKYTGSELHTLEIATEFAKRGYEVTVAVFSKTFPLLNEVQNFKVVGITKEPLDTKKFDIVFIQHFPVFDYLVTHYDIEYKYLLVSILSAFNAFETLPTCYKHADLVSTVSKECADNLKKYVKNIYIFKNSANQTFFDKFSDKKNVLNKVAIISNHVPEELKQLKNMMENQGISVEVLGAGDDQKLVNSSLLISYDLVITIGRTVQQCFACGTPVYVYDYFGGPGYINEENIQKAEDFNFSGRGFDKKTSDDLLKDILNDYVDNLKNLKYLNSVAKERYCFETNFEEMYSLLTSVENKEWKALTGYNTLDNIRIKAYSDIFPETPFLNKDYYGESQFYYSDTDGILSEENSYRWSYAGGYSIDRIFENKFKSKLFRLDPSDKPCKCKIIKALCDDVDVSSKVNVINSICEKDGFAYFLSNDSQIIIDSEGKKIEIIYRVINLTSEEIASLADFCYEENKKIKQSVAYKLLNRFG